jgi:hypothetical protein
VVFGLACCSFLPYGSKLLPFPAWIVSSLYSSNEGPNREHVLLKVKPKKSSLKLGSCTKIATRFCGPFEILDRIGPVAYTLAFPASMNFHILFHVSLLKKYVHDPNHVIY